MQARLCAAAKHGDLELCRSIVESASAENGERAELINGVDDERCTPLHCAAQEGYPHIIRWLLSSSGGGGRAAGFTNVLATTSNGRTAMQVAALYGHLECCQAIVEGSLVDNGERAELLNGTDDAGATILHLAAYEGHPLIVRWFLSFSKGEGRAAGFDQILAKTNSGMTAMELAVVEGHLECCQALVEGCSIENGERTKLLTRVDDAGRSLLHWAAREGREHIIRWLLSSEGGGRAGFSILFAKSHSGRTALHSAAENGHLECCRALVEGSNIENEERAELLNAVDNDGWTALHYAAHDDHPSIIRWLLSSEEGGGRASGFSYILARASNNSTALHFAALKGYLECCQALVEGSLVDNGERAELLNAADQDGCTALHVAAQEGHATMIRWLLSSSEEGGGRAAGFDNILAKTNEGMTTLHLAAGYGHLKCCQALVEGSNIDNGEQEELLNAVSNDGRTALHWATEEGCTSIIQWLLSSEEGGGRAAGFTSSSVTSKTTESLSALHLIIENGSVEALNALLSGCTPAERLTLFLSVDEHGWTPLHAATLCRQVDVIRELLLHHPETQTIVDARDHRGMTALHRAVIGGIDEESRKEWCVFDDGVHIARPEVISALLIAPKKQEDDVKQQQSEMEEENSQAAMTDPNLGTKIEQ